MNINKLLAKALEKAHKGADKGVIKSNLLERGERERLIKSGFIREIVKGWYMLANLKEESGKSTAWYASFWEFMRVYLDDRLGENYCLSAECSLDLWAESEKIPSQVVVMTGKGSTYTLNLPFNTSVLVYKDKKNLPKSIVKLRGMRVMAIALALVRVSPSYYRISALNVEVLLRVASVSEVCRELLKMGNVTAAGRIVGAYDRYGLGKEARQVIETMAAAGYKIKQDESFKKSPIYLAKGEQIKTPYVGRVKALWQQFRLEIIKNTPEREKKRIPKKQYWKYMEDEYVNDAYNSLSIEGYQVTPDLIEKVRSGGWDPREPGDAGEMEALTAKGYREAFEAVKTSIERIFSKQDGATVIEEDLQVWYRSMFSPSVRAGIIPAERLAGYRNHSVLIKNSRHVPPRMDIVPELMETYFELLRSEENDWVKVVLGHFMFVYIHPYMDGNGRLGRFIMNGLLADGGYRWTIIHVARRREYMNSLEKASVDNDILPFSKFLMSEVSDAV